MSDPRQQTRQTPIPPFVDRRYNARRMRSCLCAVATTVLSLTLAAAPARADKLRVLVLVGSDGDRELVERIAGQTADLEASLEAEEAVLPPDLEGQRAAARSRAAKSGADVVVWLDADASGRVVRVARGERFLQRRVTLSGAMSESASIEAVGVVVRTALQGLVAGGELENSQPAPRSSPLRAWAQLGWTGVLDGDGDAGRHGLTAQVGGAAGRWRAAAFYSYYPTTSTHLSQATLRLGRQEAGAKAGVDLVGAGNDLARWRVGVDLSAGVARFSRFTASTASGLEATPGQTTWSPTLGPAARVGCRLVSKFWLVLTFGAELLFVRPELGVERPAGFERAMTLWPVEPHASLSLAYDPS